MAELTPAPASACCSSEQQASCCEPSEKADCCTPESSSCGCSAGQGDVREQVRERYAAAARTADAATGSVVLTDEYGREVFGSTLYDEQDTGEAQGALASSLGCGVPTAVADLHEGETVLDLGSGAGADVLISARRVGPSGKAIGLDMTDEMLALARRNAAEAGIANAEFCKGYIEQIPLPDASVDVVISNCVLNLSGDKPQGSGRPRACCVPVDTSLSPT